MFRKVRVKTHLFPSFVLLVTVLWSASCRPEVTETTSHYSCCKPTLEFDQQRENTWTIDNKPIAHFNGGEQECISPCKRIEDGLMTLEACVDVNTTVVWTNDKQVTVEERTYFSVQPCSGSLLNKMAPGNQGFVGLFWLFGGLLVTQMIC